MNCTGEGARKYAITTSFVLLATTVLVGSAYSQLVTRARGAVPGLHSVRKASVSRFVPKHHVVTKRIGAGTDAPVVAASSNFSGRSGKIVITGTLGRAFAAPVAATVAGASGKTFSTLKWERVTAGSLPSGVIMLPLGQEGEPEIPAIDVTVAIPETAKNFRAAFRSATMQAMPGLQFAPVATVRGASAGERRYDERKYAAASTPSDRIVISRTAHFRRMRFVTVSIPLASLGASNGSVIARNSFSVDVTFDVDVAPTPNVAKSLDPVFDVAYRAMVANPKDIASFALPFHLKKPIAKTQMLTRGGTFDSSFVSWIESAAPYIKLTVTRTGLYRVTVDELASRSGNSSVTSWAPSSIRLINKGKEVPIWVDSTGGKLNAIEFYGLRNPGFADEYFSWETDSNAYYLTTSSHTGGTPMRYTESSGLNPATTIDRATLTLHHERDLDYYGGDDVSDQSTTLHRYLWIAGERFVWQFMKNNSLAVVDTLVLPNLLSDTVGKSASLMVFVRGTSRRQDSLEVHTCRVLVNSQQIVDATFSDYDEDKIQLQIPMGLLRSGPNTVSILFPNTKQDSWYFDYYELAVPTALEASNDTAIVKGQWSYSVAAPATDYRLDLLSSSGSPELFDIDHSIRVLPSRVTGQTYEFGLNGIGNAVHIAAATAASFLHPERINDVTSRWASILDTADGADYIVITHPNFKSAADALALRRHSVDGLRTRVVVTDDIFDAFGFGSNIPEALQHYLQYAYDHYSGVPPAFVTLMGDGTWDPKFTMPSTIHQSFVPTFGVPSSDYYFTADQGMGFPDSVLANMVIGRISVETADEANDAVRKIVTYESQTPADWNRNFLFIIGGASPDENATLFDFAWNSVNSKQSAYLKGAPTNVRASMIRRTDFSSQLDPTHIAEIQSGFQTGLGFLYFFGHGAPFITDVLFPDVGTLRNQGTYPVFLTLSCRTGAFAEPNLISLNESFLRAANAGVIMTFGTTGFGEPYYDFYMSDRIFQLMKSDTTAARKPTSGPHLINLPIVFTLSKIIQSVYSANLGFQFGQDNSLFEYTILGDAALGFSFRPQPEFHASPEDVHLLGPKGDERSTFSVFDSALHVHALLRNFGYSASGPVIVSITDVYGGGSVTLRDTLLSFDTTATIDEFLRLDTSVIGSHTLHIYVDSLNQYAETNENDNEAIVSFLVSGAYTLPFYPPEGAKNVCDITKDSVRLSWLVPSVENVGSMEILVDTTTAFVHPRTLTTITADGQLFYTIVFPRSVFPNSSSGVVWWRTLTHPKHGNDELSDVSSFSMLQTGDPSSLSYYSLDQLGRTIVSGLTVSPDSGGLVLASNEQLRYQIEARSSTDTNVDVFPYGQVFVNESEIYRTPGSGTANFNGVILLTLSHDGERVDTSYEFADPPSGSVADGQALADTLQQVVASIPAGTPAIVLTNLQPFIPGFTTNPTVTQALQSLGSANGMASLQFFGSYALIGRKGLASGLAKEVTNPGGKDGTHLFDTTTITVARGTAKFPSTAAATHYGLMKWQVAQAGGNSKVSIIVLGSGKRTGQFDTVRVIDGTSTTQADLGAIDPLTYNKLQVLLELGRDTVTLRSPFFRSLELQYDIAPEYELEPATASITPTTIMEGLNAVAKYDCQNLMCIDGVNVPVILTRSFNGRTDTVARHTIGKLAGHSTVTLLDTVSTFGLLGNVVYSPTINPNQVLNEQIDFNNSATLNLNVVRDSLKPKIDVLFDDHHINSQDFVASKVVINARLVDANPIRASDSGAIGMMLISINPPVTTPWVFKGGQQTTGFTTSFATLPSGSIQATLATTRDSGLTPGTYDLSAWGIDASGNKTDTVDFEFTVASKNSLDQVMNYPNPFKDKTWFTYRLSAAGQSDVKVVVYTIAGRKIRTLTQGPSNQRVGINAIEWDGRDENGNEIANGTYLYKLILTGTNSDGSSVSQSVLERAVKSR